MLVSYYLVPFYSGQVKVYVLLVLEQVSRQLIQSFKTVNTILYFIFNNYHELACCGEYSMEADQLASEAS